MFIIKRVLSDKYSTETRYFTGYRRTWTSDPENAEEYSNEEDAWNDLNRAPGSLYNAHREDDKDYSLVKI